MESSRVGFAFGEVLSLQYVLALRLARKRREIRAEIAFDEERRCSRNAISARPGAKLSPQTQSQHTAEAQSPLIAIAARKPPATLANLDHGHASSQPALVNLNHAAQHSACLINRTNAVHFGPDEWDVPTSVHGMLADCDGRLLRFVPDYRVNLVSPASMGDDEFDKFKTDFGLVLGYIKYARDKENLQRFVTGNERYRSVDAESAELINLLTDSRLPVGHGEERVDMCKAIEDMRAEARNEGLEKGLEKGKITTLRDLVRDGVLSLVDAAGRAGLSTEDFQAKVNAL